MNDLTRAVKQKNFVQVKSIVEAGCDLDYDVIEYICYGEEYAKEYYSILYTAMKYSTLEICEYLIDKGAKFDLDDQRAGFSNDRDMKAQVKLFFEKS